MASDIRIAVGHNNVSGLALFQESPDTNGLQFPKAIDAASGDGYWDGKPICLLRFPDVVTPAAWVNTLTKCGLNNPYVRRVRVTVRIPEENKITYKNYSAWAERSQTTPFEYCWYRTPEILITRMVEIT